MSGLFTDYETIIEDEKVEKKVEEAIEKSTKTRKKKKVEAEEVKNMVEVKIKNLNVRKGPGKEFGVITGNCKPGVYEIEDEQNGYGKIKGKDQWISLQYTNKI